MTNEQKEARKISAESGHIKWLKDNCLTTMDDGKPFVFISYKSDDYEKVLDEIVYNVCRKYGLRVYFDTAFDDKADSWIDQFYDNMCNSHCKAMIAFIDNAYYTSYATLLEMIASRTSAAGKLMRIDEFPFIPVNLEDIKEPQEGKDDNTGLGTERFADGRTNNMAGKELDLFNDLMEELQESDVAEYKPLKRMYRINNSRRIYFEKTQSQPKMGKILLDKMTCYSIMKTIIPKGNNNDGTNKGFEEVIHDKLINEEIRDVFIENWVEQPVEPVKPVELVKPVEPVKPIEPIKPVEPVEPSVSSGIQNWIYTAKGIVAHLEWDGESKSCVVKAGSQVAKEAAGFAKLEPAKNMKAKLVNDGVIVNDEFTHDYQCDKISTMINLLTGGSVSMPLAKKSGSLKVDDGSSVIKGKGTHDKPKEPETPTTPKNPGERTVIVTGPSGIKVDEATTLKQFEEACENINFCVELRNQRENSKKQMFDYLAAALLRGCDANVNKAQNGTDGEILRKGGYNYCTYTISNNVNATNPRIGSSQFTWCSNARKAMKTEDMPKYFFAEDGRVKSGHLGEYSEIFEALDENLTIGEVLKKFEAKEKGFETKNNDGIFEAWKLIKQIGSDTVNGGNGKQTIGDLLK